MSKDIYRGSSPSTSYERVTESVNHPLLKGITDKRLHMFTGGHFASQNLSSILERDRIDDEQHVKMRVWSAPGEEKPGFQEATQAFIPGKTGVEGCRAYKKGDRLGPSWTNHWVHVELTIPDSFRNANEPVICELLFRTGKVVPATDNDAGLAVEFDPECEALIFTPRGKALHGESGLNQGQSPVKVLTLLMFSHYRWAQLGQGRCAREPRGSQSTACYPTSSCGCRQIRNRHRGFL